jgi:hypothetical protein
VRPGLNPPTRYGVPFLFAVAYGVNNLCRINVEEAMDIETVEQKRRRPFVPDRVPVPVQESRPSRRDM